MLKKAIGIVKRDPSCAVVVNADVSLSETRRGQVFVQYETLVKTDLDNSVNRYFTDEELA